MEAMMRRVGQNLRLGGGLVAVLLLSLFGCSDDSQDPLAPDPTPELASAAATTRSARAP